VIDIRVARKVRHMTQYELAKQAEITQGWLSKVERGDVTPLPKTYQKIMRALGFENTNGDRIRRMPDSELVFLIVCQVQDCRIPANDRDCYKCKLEYLSSQSKG
jgi:predicted transcriptional regulator